jgi:hypothetical protein
MAVCDQDHGRVTLALAVALGLNQYSGRAIPSATITAGGLPTTRILSLSFPCGGLSATVAGLNVSDAASYSNAPHPHPPLSANLLLSFTMKSTSCCVPGILPERFSAMRAVPDSH